MRLNSTRNVAIILIFIAFLFSSSTVFSEVTGQVKKAGEYGISISLNTTGPAPDTCIVTMELPSGLNIKEASPKFSRFDAKKGQFQWLLKDIKTGTHKIEVVFDKKVETTAIKVTIRYKDIKTGNIVEEPIK